MKYDNKLQQRPTDSTTNSNWSVNDRGTEVFELDEVHAPFFPSILLLDPRFIVSINNTRANSKLLKQIF